MVWLLGSHGWLGCSDGLNVELGIWQRVMGALGGFGRDILIQVIFFYGLTWSGTAKVVYR